MTQCHSITKAGTRCKKTAIEGRKYCSVHKKALSKEMKTDNPLLAFRSGMLDPKSDISKLDKFTIDKILAPLQKESDEELKRSLAPQRRRLWNKLERVENRVSALNDEIDEAEYEGRHQRAAELSAARSRLSKKVADVTKACFSDRLLSKSEMQMLLT